MSTSQHARMLETIGVAESIAPCATGRVDRCCLLKANTAQLSAKCNPFVQDAVDEQLFGRREKRLGEGAYGIIFKTSRDFAIKCGKKKQDHDDLKSSEVREVGILRNLIHPNIVQVQQVSLFTTADCNLRVVLPYFRYNLRSIITSQVQVHKHDRLLFAFQLLRAVAFLHSKSVLHRDIKPDNILIDENKHLVLADFGLAQGCAVQGLKKSTHVVTIWYRAPELILNEQTYGPAIDVWACGATWLDMLGVDSLHSENFQRDESGFEQLYRTFLFITDSEGKKQDVQWQEANRLPLFGQFSRYVASLEKWKQNQFERLVGTLSTKLRIEKTSADERLLIGKLLTLNPDKRISAQTALHSGAFDGVREQVENELPAPILSTNPDLSLFAVQLPAVGDYLAKYGQMSRETIDATLKYLYDMSVYRRDYWSLFALAASYMHRVLSAGNERAGKLTLQQIALGCYMIASKFDSNSHEFDANDASETDKSTSAAKFVTIEHDLLRVLDFDLDRPTAHTFWQITAWKKGAGDDAVKKSTNLLISMLQNFDSVKYRASDLAEESWK